MIAPVAYRAFHDQADRDGQRSNRRDLRVPRYRAIAGRPCGRDRPGTDGGGAARAGGCGAPSPRRRRPGRADRQERGGCRGGRVELCRHGRRGGRSAGAHQPRVRQRLDDARRPARGSLVPGSRARRTRRPSTRRGRSAGAHRRVRPPAARHRAQAARRSREPARGDGGRLRPRRRRHRQGRSEPHRRIRDVQGPGEAVRRRGGRREPAHRTPLPVPPLRHRSPARTHPPVRVRGAAGAPRRARLTFHRRTRHSPIARARPRSDADGAPHLLRRPLRFAARGNRSRSAVRNAASHRRRGRRRLPERRRQVPVHPRRLRGHRGASARPARATAARLAVPGRRNVLRAASRHVRRLRSRRGAADRRCAHRPRGRPGSEHPHVPGRHPRRFRRAHGAAAAASRAAFRCAGAAGGRASSRIRMERTAELPLQGRTRSREGPGLQGSA